VPRLAVAIGAAAAALCLGLESAQACSCISLDARQGLADADAAFVGTLVARRQAFPSQPGGVSSSADPDIFTFRVDQVIKGDLGPTIEVWSARSGASCGVEAAIGQQIGLFLRRDGTRWSSGLCWQVPPTALREAALPLPAPNGSGPVRFLIGGGFGGVRLLALDARGRTLGYGPGSGSTRLLSVCPRGARAVEIVSADAERVGVRDVQTLRVVREVPLPRGAQASAVYCRDARARDVYVFARPVDEASGTILRLRGSGLSEVYTGSVQSAAFRGTSAYLSEGEGGRQIVRLDLRTGERRALARAPLGLTNIAVSPSGDRIAGVHVADATPRPPPVRLVLLGLGRNRPRARTISLPAQSFYGELAWLDKTRLAVFSYRDVAGVFDTRLRNVGRLSGWEAADSLVAGGVAYGLARPSQAVNRWSLQTARLPSGAARLVRLLPGAAAVIAKVPGGVSLRSARRPSCFAVERVFPGFEM
jgi:hypothetical protein